MFGDCGQSRIENQMGEETIETSMWTRSWSLDISNYLDIVRHPTFSYIRQILSVRLTQCI